MCSTFIQSQTGLTLPSDEELQKLTDSKVWCPITLLGTPDVDNSCQRFKVPRDQVDTIHAIRFNGTIPECITIGIGGFSYDFLMNGRRTWDCFPIEICLLPYAQVTITIPIECDFADVEILATANTMNKNRQERCMALMKWKGNNGEDMINAMVYENGVGYPHFNPYDYQWNVPKSRIISMLNSQYEGKSIADREVLNFLREQLKDEL